MYEANVGLGVIYFLSSREHFLHCPQSEPHSPYDNHNSLKPKRIEHIQYTPLTWMPGRLFSQWVTQNRINHDRWLPQPSLVWLSGCVFVFQWFRELPTEWGLIYSSEFVTQNEPLLGQVDEGQELGGPHSSRAIVPLKSPGRDVDNPSGQLPPTSDTKGIHSKVIQVMFQLSESLHPGLVVLDSLSLQVSRASTTNSLDSPCKIRHHDFCTKETPALTFLETLISRQRLFGWVWKWWNCYFKGGRCPGLSRRFDFDPAECKKLAQIRSHRDGHYSFGRLREIVV